MAGAVSAVAIVSLGLFSAPSHASVTGFSCETSMAALPGEAGLSFSASARCDAALAHMSISARVVGPSGVVEATGSTGACATCAGVDSTGAVRLALPGSHRRLLVDQTEVAPSGEVWGRLDAGPSGTCSGVGTSTSRCSWSIATAQTSVPTESTIADAAQGLVDQVSPRCAPLVGASPPWVPAPCRSGRGSL